MSKTFETRYLQAKECVKRVLSGSEAVQGPEQLNITVCYMAKMELEPCKIQLYKGPVAIEYNKHCAAIIIGFVKSCF